MVGLIKTKVARRFQRAVRLDSDFGSIDAVSDYVPLASATTALRRIGDQVSQSSQRAFTWTGPYGGGKSSLALVFGSLLDCDGEVRRAATKAIGSASAKGIQKAFGMSKAGWLVVPVVGQREGIVSVLDAGLSRALGRRFGKAVPKEIAGPARDERSFIDRLCETAAYCAETGDGVLLVIDEMGRLLEHAASAGGDLSFLQELAEIIGRLPAKVVLIGVLHQAFEQYASRLGSDFRDEWAKIQGRFVDVPLTTGPEEAVRLVGQALVGDKAPDSHQAVCARIAAIVRKRRAGLADDFASVLTACWPLHPVVALLLAALSRKRFGQNERSTFGFLNSGEPAGFQDFLVNASSRKALYGTAELWDYLRLNLEPAILASSDGHRWAQAVEVVDRAESKGGADHVHLTKAIALLDLFGGPVGLNSDDDLVRSGVLVDTRDGADAALEDLRSWSIVVHRSYNHSWAIFAGSDFDIEAELAVAKSHVEVAYEVLQEILTQQVVVAKRHYYERGTLRWFEVRVVPLTKIDALVESYKPARGACGLFVMAVPEKRESFAAATNSARSVSRKAASYPFFVGVGEAADAVRALVLELSALDSIRKNNPVLEGDQVARRELAARAASLREQLDQQLSEMLISSNWYRKGSALKISTPVQLSRVASDCADEVFHAAPAIKNELINRSKPSSNAVSAANELMRLMVLQADKKALGIEGYPPQRAIYESILARPGFHRSGGLAGYRFRSPSAGTFAPMWDEGERFLASADGSRLPLSELYEAWSKPPFGIRAGVVPIYALALLLAHESELAIYLDGQFVPQMDAFFVDRMLQSVGAIEVRRFRIADVARSTLERLSRLLDDRTNGVLKLDVLSVAKPLVSFTRALHPWVRRTRTLAPVTLACRDAILRASDPVALLFEDLPKACNLSPVGSGPSDDVGLETYTTLLRQSLHELRSAYPLLLDKLSNQVSDLLGESLNSEQGRFHLSRRAGVIVGVSGDFRLDAFATRLRTASDSVEWLESIGGLAANKPVRDWIDNDIDRAVFELTDLCARFRRVENVSQAIERCEEAGAGALVVEGRDKAHIIVRVSEVVPTERDVASQVLADLKPLLLTRGIHPDRFLSVLAEIARQAVVGKSPQKDDSYAEYEGKRTWQN